MKNIKLLMVFMLLATVQLKSTTATASANGATQIVNKSNMPIYVAYNITARADGTSALWSVLIPANSSGSLAYEAGDVIGQVSVYYNKATGNDHTVDGGIWFTINQIDGCSIYVYGNSAVNVGQTDTTVAATPVPARYAAWWTKPIDVTTLTTVDAAKADATVKASVTMHMANINGTNDSALPAGDPAAAY